jgi:hypothetical protein
MSGIEKLLEVVIGNNVADVNNAVNDYFVL